MDALLVRAGEAVPKERDVGDNATGCDCSVARRTTGAVAGRRSGAWRSGRGGIGRVRAAMP